MAGESRSTQVTTRILNSGSKQLYKWQKKILLLVVAARGTALAHAKADE